MSNDTDELFDKLKGFKQMRSDGIFYCKNKDGRKVVVLYNENEKLVMTCDTDDCDLGDPHNFVDRH